MKLKNALFLISATLFWGVSFSAQSVGGDIVGPLTFNFVRFLLGAAVLLPVIALMDKIGVCHKPADKEERKLTWKAGALCGVSLFAAANFQQLGITAGTASGKAGFITACYIVIVPIMGMFFKRRCGWNVWVGVAIAVFGLYFLCMDGSFTVQLSDLLVFFSAIMFAVQILLIDRYAEQVDGVRMACIQFLVCGVLTMVTAFLFEIKPWEKNIADWAANFTNPTGILCLLYAAIFVVGVAYTFQILGQRGANPTIASLIMSFESVFATISGCILLHETLTPRALLGCILIFSAVLLAQIPNKNHVVIKRKRKNKN